MNKFQPVNKYLLVEILEEQITTQSGLLLTGNETDQLRYKKARVAAPGTNVDCVAEGNIIYYDKNAGYTMLVNDVKYTVILERDIVVVL